MPRKAAAESSRHLQLVTKAPKAALYIRVSTHHQIDKDSLPFQRQELESYARYVLGLEYEIFEDAGYSAKNTDRPQYRDMMKRLRQGEFTHLLVWKLDRISRNLKDFTIMWDELRDLNVTFVSKMEQFDTSTAMGEAMLRIILVFAELERKLTAERVFAIMLDRAEKGLWNGAPVPLGYDWSEDKKTVVINETEAKTVTMIFSLYRKLKSTLGVANELMKRGYMTKRGGKWTNKTIAQVLRNPIYAGKLRYNYRAGGRGKRKAHSEIIVVNDAVPAIIPLSEWEFVQELIDNNYKNNALNGVSRDKIHVHPLSGLVTCGSCGASCRSNQTSTPYKNGYRPTFYMCSTRARNKTCSNPAISGLRLESFILEYIRALCAAVATEGDFFKNLDKEFDHNEVAFIQVNSSPILGITASSEEIDSKDDETESLMKDLKNKKQRIERALARLDDAFLYAEDDKAMSKVSYRLKRQELLTQLQVADNDFAQALKKQHNEEGHHANMAETLAFFATHNLDGKTKIRKVLPSIDKALLKEFFSKLIAGVEIVDGVVTRIDFYGTHDTTVPHFFIYDHFA